MPTAIVKTAARPVAIGLWISLRLVKYRFGVDVDVDVDEEDASETRLIGIKLWLSSWSIFQ